MFLHGKGYNDMQTAHMPPLTSQRIKNTSHPHSHTLDELFQKQTTYLIKEEIHPINRVNLLNGRTGGLYGEMMHHSLSP